MVLWQVDTEKYQREKGLLNWERRTREGEQGCSSSILHVLSSSSSPRILEEHPSWCKGGRQPSRQKKGSEGREKMHQPWGRIRGEEGAAEGGRGDPQHHSTVVSGVSHVENWMSS